MSKKKTRQLIVLNVVIVAVNVVVFAKPFLGLQLLDGTAFTMALAWAVLSAGIAAFFYGNFRIFKREETRSLTIGINNLDDCVRVLEESKWIKTFAGKITEMIGQIQRFRKKTATINDILLQKFNRDELTYKRFSGVLSEVEQVVYVNVRSVLNKISAFDENEYIQFTRKNWRDDPLAREKMQIFNEYISFVKEAVEDNEQILLKLDKMLLEISRYNSLEDGDVENMPAIQEMDDLIKHAGLYK